MPKILYKGHRMLTEGTPEFRFEVADADKAGFSFKAGQNVDMTLSSLAYPDEGKGKMRTFSLSSPPSQAPLFTIATRMSDSAFKKTLIELPIDTQIEITNPGGQFTLPKSAEFPLVFIAGGIGITPFMSIVQDATERTLPHKIILIYSNRSEATAAYLPELRAAAQANPNFTLIENYGPLTPELVKERTAALSTPTYYTAGPPGMVGMVKETLKGLGVSDDDILVEEFAGYQ